MSSLQFVLEVDSPFSPISPDTIDISSNSGDEFLVEPGNVPQLEERFRVNRTTHDLMTTFMGAATAMLFPSNNDPILQSNVIDTAGPGIEQELMELIEESRVISPASLRSFVGSEFEETKESPEQLRGDGLGNMRVNSYGRPTAVILRTPRMNSIQADSVSAAPPTYPQGYNPEASAFRPQQRNAQNYQDSPVRQVYNMETADTHVMPTFGGVPSDSAVANISPLIIHLPPRGGLDALQEPNFPVYPGVQWGFPFHVVHSPNVLFIPIDFRRDIRLFLTVMTNVAGHCDQCGKTYDQVALETLGNYLTATAYEGEAVRDRGVRSHAFIDGFEAALFIFKRAGLSQPLRPGVRSPAVNEEEQRKLSP